MLKCNKCYLWLKKLWKSKKRKKKDGFDPNQNKYFNKIDDLVLIVKS